MAALFAADVEVLGEHGFDDVAVADFCAKDAAMVFAECVVESEVAHDGGDEGIFCEGASANVIHCGDGEDFVAVHDVAFFVAELEAVGVAIVADADVCAGFADEACDFFGVGAAAAGVDVSSVGFVVKDAGAGTEFTENPRGAFVGGAVGDIHGDVDAFEGESFWKAGFGVFDVAAKGVVNALGLADFTSSGADAFDFAAEDEVFDALLDFVVEFVAVVAEKFDAVVLIRIVRGAEDDAGIGAQSACEIRDAGRGQRAEKKDIHAEGHDARCEGVF